MKRIKSRPVQTGELLNHGEELLVAAEEGLRESEVRYRTLFENSMDAIFITVPVGKIKEANQAACEMFGMTEEELIRAGRAGITDPSDRRYAAASEERERTGRFFGELTHLRKDGSSFPAETSSVILDGGAESFVILRDISERKRAEQELLDSEERYRKLFGVETDAILMVDLETSRFLDANPAAQELYGYTLEEFLCLTTNDISAEPDKTRQAIATKQIRVTNRLHRKKDGTVFPVEIDRGLFSYHDREVHMAAIRDITERKRAEKDLIDRQNTIKAMAMKLSVAEERERCRIAEELHDQVAPKLLLGKMRIQSLVDLLPAGAGDDAIESVVALIEQSISDIRSLTFQLRPPILANAGLEAALKWLAQEFGENYGLMVKITDDKSFKPLKYEIRSAIFQIVRELLLNVVKHAGTQNARITIKKTNDMIDIKVEDDGCGANLASFSRDRPKPGGFGLFNTKSKIEYLGGEILIDSSPGSGTRVFIRAPLDTTPEEGE